jgi:hypothetical protein
MAHLIESRNVTLEAVREAERILLSLAEKKSKSGERPSHDY